MRQATCLTACTAAVGGIELFLGGVGADGHVAFNEPGPSRRYARESVIEHGAGSSLASRTRVKTLAYETVIANARFFGGDVTKVPKMALTVGVGTIMDASEVVILVSGQHKVPAQHCVSCANVLRRRSRWPSASRRA